MGDRASQTCGKPHTQHRCFSRLDNAWRAEFGDEVERPHRAELLRSGVAIFNLDYDAILSAMYALSASAEGDCYRCVPPDPGIEAAALGASESVLPGTAPAEALHTFMLDSGASRYFFRDSTTLTPLPAPVPVRLVDPSEGPVVARSSTVLPCPAVPSGSLLGLHLPSFSTNLVSTATLHDVMVTTTTPGGQRVSIRTCTRTDRHLATFTRRPRSSLYTLATEPPQIAASAQVSASGPVAPPCSCRLLTHQTLLWHHRLGHPSLPRLRGMHSHLLVSGLLRLSTSASGTGAGGAGAGGTGIGGAGAGGARVGGTGAGGAGTSGTDAGGTGSVSTSPPFVGGECALGTDVLEDRLEDFECLAAAVPCFASMLLAREGDPHAPDILTPRSYAEAITGPYSSQWQAAMDAEMASWKSTSTYVDEVPPPGANIVDGMWIFRVKRPLGSPPAFKARYIARGFKHLHEDIWLRRPPGFTGSFPAGTQWSLRRQVYNLRQAPREWQDTLRTTLAALGFAPSSADPSLVLRTDTLLPPFYVLVYADDLVFATADTKALTLVKSELQNRHICTDLGPLALQLLVLLATTHSSVYWPLALSSTFGRVRRAEWHRKVHWDAAKRVLRYMCSTSGMGLVLGGRGPVVLTGHADASWVDDSATQWSSQGYTFSLGSGSVSWQSTRSSSVLSSSCEAEIYAGAMAAQELHWLTYLLNDLGEQPRSPPVVYVDNNAMISLCQEHILEHRTKHIAQRYFLARELQQRGQLRLAYVATRANTADIFTKALPPGDHHESHHTVRAQAKGHKASSHAEPLWWIVNRQYHDQAGQRVTETVTWGGETDDAGYSRGATLYDADVTALIADAITSQRLPYDADGVYFVLSDASVAQADSENPQADRFCVAFCGLHCSSPQLRLPHPPLQCPTSCIAADTRSNTSLSPTGDPGMDGLVSVLAHELAEAAASPFVSTWFDSDGEENADKCSWT
ncbi:unnamed protein product [Closterium sp. NIES-54]